MNHKLKGLFMLFRVLPVLVWTGTASLVAGALVISTGYRIDWSLFLFVVAVAAVIQGYPTHIVNEIFDWRSGADPKALGARKTGGSKVLQAGLLTMRELWIVFSLSTLALFASVTVVAAHTDWRLLGFFAVGYFSGIFYTLPPFRWAYRPFLGEWLGGFAGIVALVLGIYFAETRIISKSAVYAAAALGMQYISIMMFFHYLDYDSDRMSVPRKLTTVVLLGLRGSRWYAIGIALVGSTIFFTLSVISAPMYAVLALGSLLVAATHGLCEPASQESIVRNGKIITFGAWATGLCFAILADARFAFAGLLFLIGLWAHKKFGKIRHLRPTAQQPA